ncbi:MAG: hypothetical protein ACI9MB_003901 [Verrucomicrobiales bacterium]
MSEYGQRADSSRHGGLRLRIRADRNSEVRQIRQLYDEAIAAGFTTLTFSVYSTDRR